MGNIVKTGLPCTAQGPNGSCGSSNAMAMYDDGGKYCHKCQGWDNRGKDGKSGNTGYAKETQEDFVDTTKVDLSFYHEAEYKAIPERRLDEATCKKF